MTRLCASRSCTRVSSDVTNFDQNYGGNDLQAVADAVLKLFEQQVLFDHERLLLPKQVFPFPLQGASNGDVLNSQQHGRVRISLISLGN
jgi:hypothetical protein